MTKRGRPRGTGFDDGSAIARVRDLMGLRGLTRRAAIIAVCGIDQLRRIERKMAAAVAWRDVMDDGSSFLLFHTAGDDPAEIAHVEKIYDDVRKHGLRKVFGENPAEGAGAMGLILLVTSWRRQDHRADAYRSNALNPFTDDLSVGMASVSV